jgi:alpha-1,2-glucosyltransferase
MPPVTRLVHTCSAVVALASICILLSFTVNQKVPTSYMDEFFHVRQAQRYCVDGPLNAEWDDKITTLPGLYLISLPFVHLKGLFFDRACDIYSLRSINIVFLCVLLVVLVYMLSYKHSSYIEFAQMLLKAIQLTTLPVMFFFTTLYYTDIGSALFLLLAHMLARQERYTSSALVCLSICC